MHAARLTRTFDPEALQESYLAVRDAVEGKPAGYPGEGHVGWTSICLHSASAGASPVLKKASYLRTVLSELQLRIRLARLLLLEPGGFIREHQDSFLSKRIVRLHLPVVTNPEVELYLGGSRCVWRAGELWYGDFSLPHRAANRSPLARVHLVLDVTADQNLLRLFAAGQIPEGLADLADQNPEGELDQRVLERFAFDFTLPAGFQLPGMGHQDLSTEVEGCVRLIDSELCVFINQQPMLKAVPVSEDTLDLIGLAPGARLQYAFEGEVLRSVTLMFGVVAVFSFDLRSAAT